MSLISITSDFGSDSHYVAALKAHILQLLDENPDALIKENLTTQVLGNANAASALHRIRTRLSDPNLSATDREYLEKLIRVDD